MKREPCFQNVIYEGDSQTLNKALWSKEEGRSWSGQILEDMKAVFQQKTDWNNIFVYRESNKVADCLAKLARQYEEEKCWIEGPFEISLVLNDAASIPRFGRNEIMMCFDFKTPQKLKK